MKIANKILSNLKNIIFLFFRLKNIIDWASKDFPLRRQFGQCAVNTILQYPIAIDSPQNVYLEENTHIRPNVKILNSPSEKVIIKKYSVLAPGVTIITNSHRSTVSIPQFLLGKSHINDKSTDIIIEEDVWVGAEALLLPGCHLGRGCIVGARAMVNTEVPPYCLVVGSPAKIIKIKFTIDQIIKHESSIYPEEERLTRSYLEALFANLPIDLSVYGIETELSKEDLKKIENLKKMVHFVEPDL